MDKKALLTSVLLFIEGVTKTELQNRGDSKERSVIPGWNDFSSLGIVFKTVLNL